jgi:hypothetical protein
MITWLLLIAVQVSYIGTGIWISTAVVRGESWFVRLPVAYFAGVLLQVVYLHVPVIAGGNPGNFAAPGIYCGLASLGLYWYKNRSAGAITSLDHRRRPAWQALLGGVVLLPGILFLWGRLVTLPDVEYDTTAFWFLKSRLFLAGDNFGSESFQDVDRVHAHKNYPIYWSLFGLQHFAFTNVVDDWVYKPGVATFNTMGLALVFGLMKSRVGLLWSVTASAILIYSPVFCYRAVQGAPYSAFADFPLALLIAGAIGTGVRAMEQPTTRSLTAAAVFVTSTFLLKSEGLIFSLYFMLAVSGVVIWKASRQRRSLLVFAGVTLILAGWIWVRRQLPSDFGVRLDSAESFAAAWKNAPIFMQSAFERLSMLRMWGVLPLLLPVLLITSCVQRPVHLPVVVSIAVLIAYFCSVVVLFLFIEPSASGVDGLMEVTFDRILIQVLPAFLLVGMLGQQHLPFQPQASVAEESTPSGAPA